MSYQSEGIRHIEINKKKEEKYYDTDDSEDFEKTYSSDDAVTSSSHSDAGSNSNEESDNDYDESYKNEEKNVTVSIGDSDEEEREKSSAKKILPAKKSVNFDSLLKAVIDISDRIEDQEKKLKQIENKAEDRSYKQHFSSKGAGARPKTAVLQYREESEYSSFDAVDSDDETLPSMISRGSSAGKRRRRPQSSAIHRKSTEPAPFRMNMSFSNEKVKSIDAENQRLLKQLLHTKMSKPATTAPVTKRKPQARAQSASSINRSRRQQEIDRENLRILHKLQNVKPTSSLVRTSLLTDHTRLEQYSNRIGKGKPRPSSAASSTRSVRSNLRLSSGRSTSSTKYFDDTTRVASASSSSSRRSNRDRLTKANIERQRNWDDRW